MHHTTLTDITVQLVTFYNIILCTTETASITQQLVKSYVSITGKHYIN